VYTSTSFGFVSFMAALDICAALELFVGSFQNLFFDKVIASAAWTITRAPARKQRPRAANRDSKGLGRPYDSIPEFQSSRAGIETPATFG
jgi:hypothetical protein